MKFSIPRATLSNLLARVVRTVPTQHVKEILKYFVFEVSEPVDGSALLRVVSFDLELGSVVNAEVRAEAGGSVGVPADKIMDLTQAVDKDGTITFELLPSESVKITAGSASWTVGGKSPKNYPRIPKFEDDAEVWGVDSKILVEGLKKVYAACSLDDTKRAMTSVHVCSDGLLSIDGKAAYWYRASIPMGDQVTLIHRNAAKFLAEVLTPGVMVQIQEDDFFIVIRSGRDLFFVLRTDDSPIDIRGSVFPLIPDAPVLKLNKKLLTQSLNRVGVCSDSGVVSMSLVGEELVFQTKDRKGDEAEDRIKFLSWDGESFEDRKVSLELFTKFLSLLEVEEVGIMMPLHREKLVYRVETENLWVVIISRRSS